MAIIDQKGPMWPLLISALVLALSEGEASKVSESNTTATIWPVRSSMLEEHGQQILVERGDLRMKPLLLKKGGRIPLLNESSRRRRAVERLTSISVLGEVRARQGLAHGRHNGRMACMDAEGWLNPEKP